METSPTPSSSSSTSTSAFTSTSTSEPVESPALPALSAPVAPPAPAALAPVTQAEIEEAPAAAAIISPVTGENPTPAATTEPAAPAATADSALCKLYHIVRCTLRVGDYPYSLFPNSFVLVVTGANFETAIQNMMELGFPREQCMLAMRASFNNPDRAAEYLMNVSALPSWESYMDYCWIPMAR